MANLANQGHHGMQGIFQDVGVKLEFGIAKIVNALDVPCMLWVAELPMPGIYLRHRR
jgi:predicted NBD/HSP70 family sugar kinase